MIPHDEGGKDGLNQSMFLIVIVFEKNTHTHTWKLSKMASEKFSSKVDILDWAWSEVEYMFSGCPNGPKRHPKSLVSMGLCGHQTSIKCLFSA